MLISMHDPQFDQKHEEFLPLQTIYAHGKLEDILEFDMVATNSIPVYNNLQLAYPEDGRMTVETKAMDKDGNIYDVIVYAWRVDDEHIKGYALVADDKRAIVFAKEKQKKKPRFI